MEEIQSGRTYREDTRSSNLAIILDNSLQRGELILNLQNFLQLLFILHHKDAHLAVLGTVQAGFSRVGGVNASCQSPAQIKYITLLMHNLVNIILCRLELQMLRD